MRVNKVADVVNGHVLPVERGPVKVADLTAILTNLEEGDTADHRFRWLLRVEIGRGAATREVDIELPSFISESADLSAPLFIANERLVYFRDRLFMPERQPRNDSEREEMVLRAKKAVYEDESELATLRATVANLEAARAFTESARRRDSIPDDVKLLVWARDRGRCVSCESTADLQFDHIIPFARGGSNSAENIQILCQPCNLRKSDRLV
jgi:hypothetical protein